MSTVSPPTSPKSVARPPLGKSIGASGDGAAGDGGAGGGDGGGGEGGGGDGRGAGAALSTQQCPHEQPLAP